MLVVKVRAYLWARKPREKKGHIRRIPCYENGITARGR
jgi:hypothetical protein